jgi:hypothetical protein
MAKRRKKRTSSRRRSRVGAVPGGLMDIVTITAGAVAGGLLSSKLLPNLDDKIKSAGLIAIGAFVFPKIVKGATGSNLGKGMAAAGALNLLKSTGVISGMEDVIEVPFSVGEIDNLSVIAGNSDGVMAGDLSVMAGDDESDY